MQELFFTIDQSNASRKKIFFNSGRIENRWVWIHTNGRRI